MWRIVTRDEDSVNLDIGITNKWNWPWLEKKINVHVKKAVPSMTWKGDSIISFCVGESIREVNLHKETHSMSTSNGVWNKDITKVQWRIQATVVFVLRFVWISIWLLSNLILLEILHLIYLKCSRNLTLPFD